MKKIIISGLIISSLILASCSTDTASINQVTTDETVAVENTTTPVEETDTTPAESSDSKETLEVNSTYVDPETGVAFVLLEDGDHTFSMGLTEVTNEQYVKYLNSAYAEDKIVYNAERGEILTLDGYTMIQLSGSRVVKDHNRDGVYALDEMENPLNRCFIEYDEATDSFVLVDPALVDWTQYFDTSIYPNVVDCITDWAELNSDGGGFFGNGDTDKLLPTLEEITDWPVNFIRYYGAKEYADFYGYDLPTRDEWVYAARGGEDFAYATSDGTDDITSSWIQGTKPGEIHKGHVQAADSLDSNPYGIYNLGGNVWEWTKEWVEYTPPAEGAIGFGTVTAFFIDDEMRDPKIDINGTDDTSNQYKKSLIGGSFNYFSATMAVTLTEGAVGPTMNLSDDGVWEHGAYIHAGNDHFGFRVVNPSTSEDISLEDSSTEETDTNEATSDATQLPESINMIQVVGTTFSMGSDELNGSPVQRESAVVHDVTLSDYQMSEAEITNEQYVEFLNKAYQDGLIEITIGTLGPLKDSRLVTGTSLSTYPEKVLQNLDGIRVLKDHDNSDGDDNPFTGSVEPENPLNTSYIGFDELSETFYVKNPHDPEDFDWYEMCNYSDYTTSKGEKMSEILNDFADWSGSGANYSDELMGWTNETPEMATNLPTLSEVKNWPATFIQWWGAVAFAEYYDASLPTEAQWEYAAKTEQNFENAVYDGQDISDANWNQNEDVSTGHVREAISGNANPFGFYNLGGNVWEWIADNYIKEYELEDSTDPLVEVEGSTTRCWRGGSWNYHQATLQTSVRFFDEENRGNDHFGFRIVINQN
jgi:formylglycine-generating enzyme required for sulfatase activity